MLFVVVVFCCAGRALYRSHFVLDFGGAQRKNPPWHSLKLCHKQIRVCQEICQKQKERRCRGCRADCSTLKPTRYTSSSSIVAGDSQACIPRQSIIAAAVAVCQGEEGCCCVSWSQQPIFSCSCFLPECTHNNVTFDAKTKGGYSYSSSTVVHSQYSGSYRSTTSASECQPGDNSVYCCCDPNQHRHVESVLDNNNQPR